MLLKTATLVVLLSLSGSLCAQTKPNIIWMIADDIGFDIKAYRNNMAVTPTLDKLARDGVQFWRFYTPAAVCSPSRVGFSTGRHPAELAVYTTLGDNPIANAEYNGAMGIENNIPTMFEILEQHGYRTAHAGKWHRGSISGFGPEAKGIDEIFSYAKPSGQSDPLETLFLSGPTPYYGQIDQVLADWAAAFIDRTSEPFFLELSFHTPHNPLYPSDEYLQQFSNLQGFIESQHQGLEDAPATPAQRYYSSIKMLDDAIAQIITALKTKGIEDNTIILFSGDNGPGTTRLASSSIHAYGSTGPFRGNKATVYEGGIRVPFIAKGPGFAVNADIHEAISGLDIVPSLLSILGISSSEDFYGEDMSELFFGNDLRRTKPIHWITVQNRPVSESVANRSPVLAMYEPESDIKCLMQPSGGRKEAYRTAINRDPGEFNNLHRSNPEGVASCFSSLAQWYDNLPPPRRLRPGAGALYPNR